MTIEEEIQIVYNAIIHPAGFDFDIAGQLCIRRYEYPVWAVEWESDFNSHTNPKSLIEVKEFDDAVQAAKFFVEKRHEMQIGLDF